MWVELLLSGPAPLVGGWLLAQETVLRLVTVPRLYRREFSQYEVVARSEAEKQKIDAEINAVAMQALQKELDAMQRRLAEMNLESDTEKRRKDAAKHLKRVATTSDDFGARANTLNPDLAVSYPDHIVQQLMERHDMLFQRRNDMTQRLDDVRSRPLPPFPQEQLKLKKLELGLVDQIQTLTAEIHTINQRISAVTEETQRADMRSIPGGQPRLMWGGELVSTLQQKMNQVTEATEAAMRKSVQEARDALAKWHAAGVNPSMSLVDHMTVLNQLLSSGALTSDEARKMARMSSVTGLPPHITDPLRRLPKDPT